MDKSFELMNKLILAINFKYHDDMVAPGLIISALKKGYYCSVVRYPEGAAGCNKQVVCKATEKTLESALENVARQFVHMTTVQQNPLQELSLFIRSQL